jgi:hypothetical protein
MTSKSTNLVLCEEVRDGINTERQQKSHRRGSVACLLEARAGVEPTYTDLQSGA